MKGRNNEEVSSVSRGGKAFLTSLAALLFSLPLALLGYQDGPPPATTEGFGEPDCRQCHFDHPLNAPGYSLHLEGLPERYPPGKSYTLTVRLEPAPAAAGFQLSARFADGAKKGMQAGRLEAPGERVEVSESEKSLQYARHTRQGSQPGAVEWRVLWTAPEKTEKTDGLVVFHVAANAADGDDSPLGDFIYTLEEVRTSEEGANSDQSQIGSDG